MKTNKLEILKRKQIGTSKIESFENLFESFGTDFIKLTSLEESDSILEKLKVELKEEISESEFLPNDVPSFLESDLLRELYLKLGDNDQCYLFTDDFLYCGLALVNAKKAFEQILNLAQIDQSNTCFLLDKSFNYYYRINYYNVVHPDHPNTFDIERLFKLH